MCVCVCREKAEQSRHRSNDTAELRAWLSEEHSHCTPVLDRLNDNVGTRFDMFR